MKMKDENTGTDAGVNELDDMNDDMGRNAPRTAKHQPLSSEERGAWSDADQDTAQDDGEQSKDSGYVPPARPGTPGSDIIEGNPLGGQGEMIAPEPQAFPGEQTDPAYMDTASTSASNAANSDGSIVLSPMGGGYAGGPAQGSNAEPGAGRHDMSGDMESDKGGSKV